MKKCLLVLGAIGALGIPSLRAQTTNAETSWAPQVSAFARDIRARLEQRASTRVADCPVRNWGEIEPGVFRGAQPSGPDAYAFLKNSGVVTVINLRYFHSDDQKLCQRYGLYCVQFPLLLFPGEDEFFNWDVLRKAFAFMLIQRREGRTVFIHCKHGSDRAGVLAAALLIRAAALSQKPISRDELWGNIRQIMKNFGFHPVFIFLKLKVKDWIFHPASYSWITKSSSAMD